ncbi:MAG TPA: U32 family peptidase [Methanoregulaceae archaeon]|nr:U32 family peptidase [Methanoregulaceae archaeon]
MKIPELLAPAGSTESLVAAVRSGADAVYLGGPTFGARGYAKNFDRPGLLEAIAYAHLRDVRVYVTVNTLVLDREMNDAAEFLFFLYESGADAVLIQDYGVASVAREIVPDLPLHASTQMTIFNREGVEFAKKAGFSRVVLARELSFATISDIGKSPECRGIGLEMFVHGALCYSYSGQCLMSSFIGGRSGNRGLCAQPCRKPYTLVSGPMDAYGRPVSFSQVRTKGEYLLSTRDLSLYPILDRVVDLPVESLKIEGRMRSPRYVGTVIRIYREALDRIRAGDWKPTDEDEHDLALAFNRGFTRGYGGGARHDEIMGRDRPDHRGLFAGIVTSYDQARHLALVSLRSTITPKTGDGVVFREPRTETEIGLTIQHAVVATDKGILIALGERVSPGTQLYVTRISDPAGVSSLEAAGGGQEPPWIPVDVAVSWDDQKRPVISGRAFGKQGREVSGVFSGTPMSEALTRPLTTDTIRLQLSKTGGTPFRIEELAIAYPGGLFSPVGDLNRLRRGLFSALTRAIVTSWEPSPEDLTIARERLSGFKTVTMSPPVDGQEPRFNPMSLAVYVSGHQEAGAALAAGCDRVYFEPDPVDGFTAGWCSDRKDMAIPFEEIVQAIIFEIARLCNRFPGKVVWKWPLITDSGFIDVAISSLRKNAIQGLAGIMTDSPGIAEIIRNELPEISIYGSQGLNIFNHRSAMFHQYLFDMLTLSPELSRDDIRTLVATGRPRCRTMRFEVIVQGNADVLVSRDCLITGTRKGSPGCTPGDLPMFLGILDRTGRAFPIWTDWSCRTHLLNSSETCLADEIPWIESAGVASVAIDARRKPPRYSEEMVRLYREVMAGPRVDGRLKKNPGILGRIKELSLGGITAAHFRGSLLVPVPEE